MAAPIELYYWPTPNGRKVSIALEEMGLDYVIRPIDIGKGAQFTPEFLAISPNNRMPAIVDPDGPGGRAISVFESGAILQYLARKTGRFYGADERARVAVDEWLFWQVGGLGPMSGQANHFRNYAKAMVDDEAKLDYGAQRYTNEVNRLYGVIERVLADRPCLAGEYSIADMAAWPWITSYALLGQDLEAFPRLKAWYEQVGARPAVARGAAVGAELRKPPPPPDSEEAAEMRRLLFQQKANS